MFGLKRIEKKIDDVLAVQDEDFRHHCRRINEIEKQLEDQNHVFHLKIDTQKLELSKINGRFHDLGEKLALSQKNIDALAMYSLDALHTHEELFNKIVMNDAIYQHVKELNEKMSGIFTYIDDVEKVMLNVDTIIEQCLPEKTLKLPKKKKAITEAS